ncbi:hypothetical protein FB45DRAFT_1033517 [Roridomyces roridus]|uniref:Heme haloperoxidase family profile domain-containing protein n=1 Tax=Roridomyces roridus TaxID=1738132 RepID=A0AAD7BFI2_9AGAR|nr:hypothetical protein FB45DRAFT_1033517 [Roridomyces roridus]
MSSTTVNTVTHPYIPARSGDSRSPCPALNALANHGYIPRRGTKIHFTHLLNAVRTVYNLTLPLAFLLTIAGFVTCAKLSFSFPSSPSSPTSPVRTRRTPSWPCQPEKTSSILSWSRFTLPLPSISWTLDLESLCARGWTKITHDAALVHTAPTNAPDPILVQNLLTAAERGLTLRGLADYHAERTRSLTHPESTFHSHIGLAECGLAWLMLRTRPAATTSEENGLIEPEALRVWMGDECLPEAWCGNENAQRPGNAIGLREAHAMALIVGKLSESTSR